MNAVGIDISKGKNIMMSLQPMNQVVLKPKEYPHTEVGLKQMAHAILRLGEDMRVIMEATGHYHEPLECHIRKIRNLCCQYCLLLQNVQIKLFPNVNIVNIFREHSHFLPI